MGSLGLLDRRGGREAGYHKLWFQVWAGDCDCVRPEGRPLRAVEQDAADWPADNLREVWREGHCGRAYHSDGVQHQDGQAVPVRKQGGSVQVQINVNAKAQFESKYWRGVLDAQGKVDGGYY